MAAHPTFVISYRDPDTGGQRTAYVDAADWADAERQVELIANGEVTGELIETGPLDGIHLHVGRA